MQHVKVTPPSELMRTIFNEKFWIRNVEEWQKFRGKNAQKCVHKLNKQQRMMAPPSKIIWIIYSNKSFDVDDIEAEQ